MHQILISSFESLSSALLIADLFKGKWVLPFSLIINSRINRFYLLEKLCEFLNNWINSGFARIYNFWLRIIFSFLLSIAVWINYWIASCASVFTISFSKTTYLYFTTRFYSEVYHTHNPVYSHRCWNVVWQTPESQIPSILEVRRSSYLHIVTADVLNNKYKSLVPLFLQLKPVRWTYSASLYGR